MGQRSAGLAILCAAIAVSVFMTVAHLDARAPQDDARQFARMAYSLAQTGTLSTDDPNKTEIPAPTARREPLYPAILAGALILADPADLAVDKGLCFVQDGACPRTLLVLRLPNIILHILLSLVTAYCAWSLTADRKIAVASGTAIALFSGFISESNILYAETAGALLVVVASTAFHQSFCARTQKNLAALLAGLSLGALILVKAVFFYFLVLVAAAAGVGIGAARLGRLPPGHAGRLAGIAAIAAATIFPWMLRNHAAGEGWSVSGRGAEVLAIRASYDTMPWRDIPAAFLAVIPVGGETLVKCFFGPQTWARFDRENPSSYYKLAKSGLSAAHRRAAEKDVSLKRAALDIFADNPAKHLALTAVFAFSGAIPQLYMRQQDLPWPLLLPSALLGLLLVPAALGLAGMALALKTPHWLIFLAPAIFSFGFHAFFTHFIPRYSMMLIPVFTICVFVMLSHILRKKLHALPS